MSVALTMKADALADLGRHADALALCRERLSQEPDERRTLCAAAHCALVLNDAVTARDFARTLISSHPDHPYGYAVEAILADRERLSCSAEPLYREALKRAPEHPYYYRLLADFLARWHRKAEAITIAEEGLRYDAQDEASLRLLARLYREGGDLVKAEDYGRRALAADPEQAESHAEAGLRQLERGEHEAAIATLRQGLSFDPRNKTVQDALIEGHLRTARLFRLRIGVLTFACLLTALLVWLAVCSILDGFMPRAVVGVVAVILTHGSFFVFCYGICRVIDPSRTHSTWATRALLVVGFAASLFGAKLVNHYRLDLASSPFGVTLVDHDGQMRGWLQFALGLLVLSGLAAGFSYYVLASMRGPVARAYRARLQRRLQWGRL